MSGFDNGSLQGGIFFQTKQFGSILRGFGPPVPQAGVVGDLYLDVQTWQLFTKRSTDAGADVDPWGHYLFVVPATYQARLKWFNAYQPTNDVGIDGDYCALWGGYPNYGLQLSIYGPKAAGAWPANPAAVAVTLNPLYTAEDMHEITGTPPTQQIFTAGNGTYVTRAGVTWLRVRMVGAGGGGGASGTGSPGTGTAGGPTTFGSSFLACGGGQGGPNTVSGGFTGGIGGAATGGDINIQGNVGIGNVGNSSPSVLNNYGENGASSPFGAGGGGGVNGGGVGGAATGFGSGGGGAGGGGTPGAAGAGSGGYLEKIITAPLATYAYSVGAGGAGGAAGAGGGPGGAGAGGYIIVEEHT